MPKKETRRCKSGLISDKVDRATMGVALEGREPLLDHKIIEFALALPDDLKIKGNTTKYLLRQVLYRHVPKEMIERPKQGFSIPVQKWLLGSLRGELDALSVAESQNCKWPVVSIPNGVGSAIKAVAKDLEWLMGFDPGWTDLED